MGNTYYDPPTFDSIATTVVGSGGVSEVTFSDIPDTFTHLQIRALVLNSSHSGDVRVQFNGDTGSNYSYHYLYGSGSAASSNGSSSSTYIVPLSEYSNGGYGIFDILDYKNTNKYKTVRSLDGHSRDSGGDISMTSGLWVNTNAITSIKFFPPTGTFAQYSHFALYGMRVAS